jgi:hypothetical protein
VAKIVELLFVAAGSQPGTVLSAAMAFDRAGPTNPGALVEMLGMFTFRCQGLPVSQGREDGGGGSDRGQNMSAIHTILLRDESSRANCAIVFLMVNLRYGTPAG